MKILSWAEIQKALRGVDLLPSQEQGFLAYSQKRVEMPPVGHLNFDDDYGECHIKSGGIRGDSLFVIKIANSTSRNLERGLPVGSGVILVFDQKTGSPVALLQDDGNLTHLRTAIAGAIVAKYFMPSHVERIGIVGTGIQSQLQLDHLRKWTSCRQVLVWGRNPQRVQEYINFARSIGFQAQAARTLESLTHQCRYIITATSSRSILIHSEWVHPGTHITALGADGNQKRELDPQLFKKADRVIVDSIQQCSILGDSFYAIQEEWITQDDLVELGRVIENPKLGRRNDQEITVADLTGLAVQDLQIAKAVMID